MDELERLKKLRVAQAEEIARLQKDLDAEIDHRALVESTLQATEARLTERCETYKGQVKAGAAEIARLRERAIRQSEYSIQLARIVETVCKGGALPAGSAHLHHHKMAAEHLARLRQLEAAPAPIPVSDELRRLSEAATKGPWEACERGDYTDDGIVILGDNRGERIGVIYREENAALIETLLTRNDDALRASLTTGGDDGR